MRYLSLLLVLLAMCGCAIKSYPRQVSMWVTYIDTSISTDVIFRYGMKQDPRSLRFEHSYVAYGNPGSYQIDKVRIDFTSQEILEVKEAREMLVFLAEGLLERINNSASMGAQLSHTLTSDDLEIYVNFESFFGKYIDPTYVGYMRLRNGWSEFNAFDMKDWHLNRWEHRIEPYVQSKQIVDIENQEHELFMMTMMPPSSAARSSRYTPDNSFHDACEPMRPVPTPGEGYTPGMPHMPNPMRGAQFHHNEPMHMPYPPSRPDRMVEGPIYNNPNGHDPYSPGQPDRMVEGPIYGNPNSPGQYHGGPVHHSPNGPIHYPAGPDYAPGPGPMPYPADQMEMRMPRPAAGYEPVTPTPFEGSEIRLLPPTTPTVAPLAPLPRNPSTSDF